MLTDCTVNRPFPFVSLRGRRYEYKRNVIVHSRIVVVFVIPGPFGGVKNTGTAHRSFVNW